MTATPLSGKTVMKEILIEKMQNSEIDEAAGILTEAFETNPAYSLIFTKKEHIKDGLLWMFRASLIINNHKSVLTRVIKEKGSGKIIGTYTLVPPQGVKSGFAAYLKTGMPGFVLKFGLNPFSRMIELSKLNAEVLKNSIKVSRYHYLSMVAVCKEYRGSGIGSYAVKYALNEVVSSHSGCNIMGLTTQLPENITFYSRLGFTKLDEGYVSYKGGKYYNYNMKLNLSPACWQQENTMKINEPGKNKICV